jgi:hypothetical protein
MLGLDQLFVLMALKSFYARQKNTGCMVATRRKGGQKPLPGKDAEKGFNCYRYTDQFWGMQSQVFYALFLAILAGVKIYRVTVEKVSQAPKKSNLRHQNT